MPLLSLLDAPSGADVIGLRLGAPRSSVDGWVERNRQACAAMYSFSASAVLLLAEIAGKVEQATPMKHRLRFAGVRQT
ncbi:hypothetical protein [Streptomyces sp. NPDC059863]|uniref:hypothetical protein n=1 Tax=unclassified Streptomyces TaxID=2593676 RepID=UPI003650140B